MALILLINLAFSVVGFFFIFRMWREVKSRRDYYGENFSIPKGRDRTGDESKEQLPQGLSMEQVSQLVALEIQRGKEREEEERRREEQSRQVSEGDLQKMIAAAVRASQGGD